MKIKPLYGLPLNNWGADFTYSLKNKHEGITGIACLTRINTIPKPLIAATVYGDLCLADNGYTWLMFLPDKEKWCLSALYDETGGIVEWYFDIIGESFVDESGMSFFSDMYLDVVVRPNGEVITLDEDELEEALASGDITCEEYDNTYKTYRHMLTDKTASLEYVKKLCGELWALFNV